MAKQTIELAPGESKEISFEAVPAKAKTYSVSVDGLSGSFTAIVPVAAGSIVADSWVMDANPDIAFGSGLYSKFYLYVCGYYSREITFIKANLPPPGSEIASAKLRLYYKGYPAANPAGNTINIHRVLGDWDEATITWNNMPTRSTTIIASQIVPDSFGWVEWDITDEVRYLIEHPDENFGWCLENPKNTYPRNDTQFYSKEAGINQPYVDIIVTAPPLAGVILDAKWRETGTDEWHPLPVSLPAYTGFDCKWRVRNNSNGRATFTTGIIGLNIYRAYGQTVTTLDPGEEADLIYIGFAGFSAGTSGSQVIYLGALSGTITETGQQYWYEAELVDSATLHYSWY